MTFRQRVQFSNSEKFEREEVVLAFINHGMQLEGLRYPITPIGMHYLLIHFDIPRIDARTYSLPIGGSVRRPLRLTLENIKARPAVTIPVIMECAGTGRAYLTPRPIIWPWFDQDQGCYAWTGTLLRPILEEAGLLDEAVEILFTGHDRGFDQGIEHNYERSLTLDEALRDGVILAYEANGRPLPPQHGFPLRLIVPDWYGMTSVKWLKSITAINRPFEGVQQAIQYRYRQSGDDPGTPITFKRPRAMMVPPGIPDVVSRTRFVQAGATLIQGRAWSGRSVVTRVEFSADRGRTWRNARLDDPIGPYAWRGWSYEWLAQPGEYELWARATDAAGRTQPIDEDEVWNYGGYGANVVQRVSPVIVR